MLRPPARSALLLLLGLGGALLVYHASQKRVDFRVYYLGIRGVVDGTKPVYGESSGLGWPMHYRYPPLFLYLFYPFSVAPIAIAAALWASLKLAALVGFLRSCLARLRASLGAPRGAATWLLPLLIAGPYVVEEVGYGNVQLLVVCLAGAALLVSDQRPRLAALALGLAAAIKVWPLAFVPYLAARGRRGVAALSLAMALALTLLPALWLGLDRQLALLGAWRAQESEIQLGASEVWFPSQSLRGVLMRYLTELDYSLVPDSSYELVNFASLDPRAVLGVWLALAATGYAGLLVLARARAGGPGWCEHALAFVAVALLEPFTQRIALVLLLLPAIVAGRLLDPRTDAPRWRRALVLLAAALVSLQPLLPGGDAQRLGHVLGLDFLASCALAVALGHASLARSLDGEPEA